VLIILIFAVFLSVAYTTLNKLFAVFLYIIFAVLLKMRYGIAPTSWILLDTSSEGIRSSATAEKQRVSCPHGWG